MIVGTIKWEVVVLGSRRRLQEVTDAMVSAAVERILAPEFEIGRIMFSVEAAAVGVPASADQTYLLTVVALGTYLQEIAEFVSMVDFRTKLIAALGNSIDILGPKNLNFEIVPVPAPPPAPPTAVGTTIGLPNPAESNISGGGDDLPSYGIALICVLIFLCILVPLLLCIFARSRVGKGNEMLWIRYKLAHHNPSWPLFYIPRDLHERLRLQLYRPKEFEAQLRKEMDEQEGELEGQGPHQTAV
jgi:hypothetical protein